MIISKIRDSLDKKAREDVAYTLDKKAREDVAYTLDAGDVLAFGLAAGLAGWLVFGLVGGLAGWLAFGLAFGLAAGLAFGVLSPLWLFIPAILLMAEILFYFDSKKLPKGMNRFWFTLERKAEAIFETLLITVNMMNIYYLCRQVDFYKILMENCHIIATTIFWLGVVAVGITALAVWVWLNSLKYRETKHEEAKPNPFAKSDEWREKHRKEMLKYWRKRKQGQRGSNPS